ncbi:MAG: DnaA regulatory inactivator Hda [Gammaproteobacteria bacterium]|nr:DnaA regulatory inactivator Hda [Gammaproteobacteria bacterium]NNJ96818.1 DnaA regulatory inactivator Hda [Gammaproteobacteria bacterium]
MTQHLYQQLPLSFEFREHYTFDGFIAGRNQLIVDLIKQMASGQGEVQVLIWAGQGSGKSHLLQAACNLASRCDRSVCYLPARELKNSSPQVFDALEQLDMVCIDDVDLLMQSMVWEEALFDLFNRIRDAGKRLILSSTQSPDSCPIQLADLRSRLSWGPVVQLQDLDDHEKMLALKQRADRYGLVMTDAVANYLLTHYPRDLFDLFKRLDDLDKAAMAQQRRLTIPFIKSVLQGQPES